MTFFDAAVAARYDDPADPMNSPDVIGPAVDALAGLAAGGAAFEFAIGGLVVFLAGLTAVDLMPVRAAGAVKGTIGLMSYLGAATQDWVSGLLLKAGESEVAGQAVINFDYAFAFWIGASILSMVLATFVWNIKPED